MKTYVKGEKVDFDPQKHGELIHPIDYGLKTVATLIEALQKCDPDSVVIYTDSYWMEDIPLSIEKVDVRDLRVGFRRTEDEHLSPILVQKKVVVLS